MKFSSEIAVLLNFRPPPYSTAFLLSSFTYFSRFYQVLIVMNRALPSGKWKFIIALARLWFKFLVQWFWIRSLSYRTNLKHNRIMIVSSFKISCPSPITCNKWCFVVKFWIFFSTSGFIWSGPSTEASKHFARRYCIMIVYFCIMLPYLSPIYALHLSGWMGSWASFVLCDIWSRYTSWTHNLPWVRFCKIVVEAIPYLYDIQSDSFVLKSLGWLSYTSIFIFETAKKLKSCVNTRGVSNSRVWNVSSNLEVLKSVWHVENAWLGLLNVLVWNSSIAWRVELDSRLYAGANQQQFLHKWVLFENFIVF